MSRTRPPNNKDINMSFHNAMLSEFAIKILNWDKQDILVLQHALLGFIEYRQMNDLDIDQYPLERYGVEMLNLPSAKYSKFGVQDYRHFPIWACDEAGVCLVGHGLNLLRAGAIIDYYHNQSVGGPSP